MGQFMDDAYDELDADFERYIELRDDPAASDDEVNAAYRRWRFGEAA